MTDGQCSYREYVIAFIVAVSATYIVLQARRSIIYNSFRCNSPWNRPSVRAPPPPPPARRRRYGDVRRRTSDGRTDGRTALETHSRPHRFCVFVRDLATTRIGSDAAAAAAGRAGWRTTENQRRMRRETRRTRTVIDVSVQCNVRRRRRPVRRCDGGAGGRHRTGAVSNQRLIRSRRDDVDSDARQRRIEADVADERMSRTNDRRRHAAHCRTRRWPIRSSAAAAAAASAAELLIGHLRVRQWAAWRRRSFVRLIRSSATSASNRHWSSRVNFSM